MTTYQEKLQDPRWKAKAAEIKALKGDYCNQCRSEEEVHVHHMVYTTSDPWDEPNQHLIPLCECCHTSEHDKINSGRKIDLMESAMMGGYTPEQMRRIESDLRTGVVDVGGKMEHMSIIGVRVLARLKETSDYHGLWAKDNDENSTA